MPYFRTSAIVLSALLLSACVTWEPISVSPAIYFESESPDRVRVTRTDGVELTLEDPAYRAGSIVATTSRGAVEVADIQTLEVEEVSLSRTLLWTVPAAVVLFGVAKVSCRC